MANVQGVDFKNEGVNLIVSYSEANKFTPAGAGSKPGVFLTVEVDQAGRKTKDKYPHLLNEKTVVNGETKYNNGVFYTLEELAALEAVCKPVEQVNHLGEKPDDKTKVEKALTIKAPLKTVTDKGAQDRAAKNGGYAYLRIDCDKTELFAKSECTPKVTKNVMSVQRNTTYNARVHNKLVDAPVLPTVEAEAQAEATAEKEA